MISDDAPHPHICLLLDWTGVDHCYQEPPADPKCCIQSWWTGFQNVHIWMVDRAFILSYRNYCGIAISSRLASQQEGCGFGPQLHQAFLCWVTTLASLWVPSDCPFSPSSKSIPTYKLLLRLSWKHFPLRKLTFEEVSENSCARLDNKTNDH